MKKMKEIVLYVEDRDPVTPKETDSQYQTGKKKSLIYEFLKKVVRWDMVLQTGK
jgi:hypothetical protein